MALSLVDIKQTQVVKYQRKLAILSRPGNILDLGLGQVRGGSLGGRRNSSPLLSRSFFVDKVNGSALMVVAVSRECKHST